MAIRPVSVSQLNNYIKRILQTDPLLNSVSVVGEISNLKFHSSGHVYFSLKDDSSRINCFLSAENFPSLGFVPEEGMEVVAEGYIYIYLRGGSYSLNIRSLEKSGQGELAAEFERLKKKLEAEGIFDSRHKKEIPDFPGKVAVVTSPTGAAVRDILKIITKKNDYVDVLVYPVLVQGERAAGEISAAIDDLNRRFPDTDVMIVGRGGGSLEELWAFNEEKVARSIYASDIPVISAVGHETDFTISDFAADMRAETPTAAADAAVPDIGEVKEHTDRVLQDMKALMTKLTDDRANRLHSLDPNVFLRDLRSRIALERLNADNMINEMGNLMRSRLADLTHRTELMREIVEAADPKTILKRGYSIVKDEHGNVITDTEPLRDGQLIRIEAAKGRAEARIVREKG